MADEGAAALADDAEAEPPAGLPVGLDPVGTLHLAQRGAAEHLGAAGRPVPELEHREPREVGDAGGHVAGGGEPADVAVRRRPPRLAGEPARVAGREPGVGRVGRGDVGVAHAQGLEDVLAHVLGIRLPGRRRHDLPGEREGQVRVLPARLGGQDGFLAGKAGADRLQRRELAVGPVRERRLAREPGGVREEVTDRDRRRLGVARGDGEPGEMPDERVVEPELAGVAELQDRGGREELRDRGDAVERLGRRRRASLEAGPAEASGPDEGLVVDDRDRQAGHPGVRHLRLDPGGEQIEAGADVGVPGEGRRARRHFLGASPSFVSRSRRTSFTVSRHRLLSGAVS